MIKLQDMTPDVYYNQSRDFQYIGRLFDIVLNSVKTNADLIKECPLSMNSDERLIDLMTMTLGFKSKHNYNVKQLTALCSAFCEIIKNKGSLYSIELAARTLFSAESVKQDFEYDINEDNTEIAIYVPEELTDLNLFRDLLTYILPAGMRCKLIRTALFARESTEIFKTTDKVTKSFTPNADTIGTLYRQTSGYDEPLTKDKEHIYSNARLFQGTAVQAIDTTDNDEEEEQNNG